jgi:hypothetical protein
LTLLVAVDERAIGQRSAAGGLDAVVALSIVVALIGILFLPLVRGTSDGSSITGGGLIRGQQELCYSCTEDAPYPMLLWLELIVCVAGLVAGLGLSVRGGGWRMAARTAALVAAAILLLWAPVQTESNDRPVAILVVFELAGALVLAVAASTVRTASGKWVVAARAVTLAFAGIALAFLPGTRGQMRFTYDQLLWGYAVAVAGTAVAIVSASVAALRPPVSSAGT